MREENSVAHFVFSYPGNHEVPSLFSHKVSFLLETACVCILGSLFVCFLIFIFFWLHRAACGILVP